MELDVRVEQRLVRPNELPVEVLRPLLPVDVVAEHDGEREGKLLCRSHDRRRGLVLPVVAGPGVAEYQKANGVIAQGEGQFCLRGERARPAQRHQRRDDSRESAHG
jgi:hypothetical protein